MEFHLEKPLNSKQKETLEKELNVKIKIKGKTIEFTGDALEEYEASLVLEAIIFGFPIKTALLLKDPEFLFREIAIKNFTRRKSLDTVKARIIGKHGKTKETIEKISGCKVIVKENSVGIIGLAEEMEYAITAITNLIKGSKQSNVYSYLERINRERKK